MLECSNCGQPTHEDTSELWEDIFSPKNPPRRVCFDCAPPDEVDVRYPQADDLLWD